MGISISKSDVIWSYISQVFGLGAGLITLPLILHMLTTEEIAMNYLMLTVGAMVAILDFGFSPQFGRNFTYVFSGAQKLEKEGLNDNVQKEINYHLLKCLIDAAEYVYRVISVIVLVLMLTFGTWYIYHVTNAFSNIHNSLIIWIIFCASTFFNIYFSYYIALLVGRGLVKESKKATIASRIVYIIFAYLFLLFGMGLMGVCIANFLAPFVSRWMSFYYFYDESLRSALENEKSSRKEVKELFSIVWYNAKKLGIASVGAYSAMRFSLFISGLYLSFKDISSFGLLIQFSNIIVAVSTTFNATLIPQLTFFKVNNDTNGLIKHFAWTLNVYYFMFLSLSFLLILFGPCALRLIGSNANLPSTGIVSLYLFVLFLENNHGLFASFITIGNSVPYTNVALISGTLVCVGDFLVLQYTHLGLLGLVLVQGMVQLAYNNWYWPRWVCRETNITIIQFVYIGLQESYTKIQNYFNKTIERLPRKSGLIDL